MKIVISYQSAWWNAPAYYTYMIIKAILLKGHQVFFVGNADTPAADHIKELNVEMIDIDLYSSPLNFIRSINSLKKIIVSNKIDLLLPISAPSHIMLGFIKKSLHNKLPLIKFCFDNIPPKKHLLNKYLHNKLTDLLIFPGIATKNRYEGYFDLSKYKIMHAPLDLNTFCNYNPSIDIKKKFGLPKDMLIVSFIGRLSPEKGIFFLLEIIKSALQKCSNAYFIISGSEEQIKYSDLHKSIEDLGIQKSVKIINKVNDVRELISITDIGILSSQYSEYICRIVLEFMAFKKPVVAPDVNVIPEVIEDGSSGFIYPRTNVEQASDHLAKLCNDAVRRDNMANSAYNRILNYYSLEKYSDELESILINLSQVS